MKVYIANWSDVDTVEVSNEDREYTNLEDASSPQVAFIGLTVPDALVGWAAKGMETCKEELLSYYDEDDFENESYKERHAAVWKPLTENSVKLVVGLGKTWWCWVLVKPSDDGTMQNAFAAFQVFERKVDQ